MSSATAADDRNSALRSGFWYLQTTFAFCQSMPNSVFPVVPTKTIRPSTAGVQRVGASMSTLLTAFPVPKSITWSWPSHPATKVRPWATVGLHWIMSSLS